MSLFAGWETERPVTHLPAVGIEEAADILVMARQSDREALLSLLTEDFRTGIEAFCLYQPPELI